MNTIQINLLETKQIAAHVNGYATSFEGGYRIVAGEANATQFLLSSVPVQYEEATFSVKMINSQKRVVNEIIALKMGDTFVLPAGMAVAGYGQIIFSCNYNEETVVWVPLKIKIWNTRPDWEESSVSFASDVINRLEEAESNITKLEGELGDIYSVFGTEEGDQDLIVNTLRELLDVFKNYPEGLDIHKELTDVKKTASDALKPGDVVVYTEGSYRVTDTVKKKTRKKLEQKFETEEDGTKATIEIYVEGENGVELPQDSLPVVSFYSDKSYDIAGEYSGEEGTIKYQIISYTEVGKTGFHIIITIDWNSAISSSSYNYVSVDYDEISYEEDSHDVSGGDHEFPLEKGSMLRFHGFDNSLESEKHLVIEGTRLRAEGYTHFVSGNITLVAGKNIGIAQEENKITIIGADTPSAPTNYVTTDTDQEISGSKTFLGSVTFGDYETQGLGITSNGFGIYVNGGAYNVTFQERNGTIALDEDIPLWARTEEKPTYTWSEITGENNFVSTDTSQTVKGNKYFTGEVTFGDGNSGSVIIEQKSTQKYGEKPAIAIKNSRGSYTEYLLPDTDKYSSGQIALTGDIPAVPDPVGNDGKVLGVVDGSLAYVDKVQVTVEANSTGGSTYTIKS